MASKNSIQRMAFIFVALLWFNQLTFAQSEIQSLQLEQDSIRLKKYSLFDNLSVFSVPGSGENWLLNPASPALNNFQTGFEFGKKQPPKIVSVSQNKFETELPGLGSIEHFTNQFRWNAGKRVAVDFGAGLARKIHRVVV